MMESQRPIQKSLNPSECCHSNTNAATTATMPAIIKPGPVSMKPALRALRPPSTADIAPCNLPRLPTSTPITAADPRPIKDALSRSAVIDPSANHSETTLTASVALPSPVVIPARNPGAAWKIGINRASPRRPAAAPTFWKDARTVLPIFSAPPPIIVSMASAKSSKPTLPSEIIFFISSAETPYCSDRTGNRPICLSSNCASSSPWSLPPAATLPKIEPISLRSTPATAAESATNPRMRSSSSPGSMPAATKVAAWPAASPKPKAVPVTEFMALSMMVSTSPALFPRAVSLARASSMDVRRAQPFCTTTAGPARAAAAPATLPNVPIKLNAPVSASSQVFLAFLPISWMDSLALRAASGILDPIVEDAWEASEATS